MLREADRRKDEFLATLAHELRNPLAPISNALQIWARVEKNPEQATRLREMMDRQVKQLKRLIDDLLDVSRISRGKIELRREPVDLASTIEGAVESVRPYIDACGHRLIVRIPPQRVLVNGDAGRLMQVFGNLLHNAAKYTEGHGTIEIGAHVERDTVEVSVKDNGAGIPQEMLGAIFEAFTQVHKNLDRAQGGLGIGLTLVKNLVELHGGLITARSGGPGQGSEFVVTLPCIASVALPIPQEEARIGTALVSAPGAPRYRVLVVDDLKPSADTLALMLQDLGQVTSVAYDGAAALRAARQFHPDIIISDIAMPGMDGYHLAQCIRQEMVTPQILVALTGYGQQHDKWRAFEAGFDYHLVKPTSTEALAALLLKVGAGESDARRGASEHDSPSTSP
jgi:CheY-like chemotaxis protein/two-component sensor histidine kinase